MLVKVQVYIANPALEFAVSDAESKIWFAVEVVNKSVSDERIVGFETSCKCKSLDQSFPMELPKGESRFLTGTIDTKGTLSRYKIQSDIFLESGSVGDMRFYVTIAPQKLQN